MIEVNNLSYTYAAAQQPAVKGLSFAIQPGEVFGFLGPSGAGKSTTQKVLIGLLREFQGQVQVFGKDLRGWKSDYYERIGVAFEVPNLYLKLTGLENLRYFASLYSVPTADPEELLALVDLAEDGKTPVGQYSKGMKVRLNVARSLLHQPALLFMDEPTAGLDPVNARRVKEIVRSQRAAGKTVFLTTHDMTVANELCDRVAFIVDGEIKQIDAPKALTLRFGKPLVRVEHGANGVVESRDFALDGLADNPDFLALLRDNAVRTMHTQEASLEDIFIQVTGRSLA
jgi:fluoroquinolone transport system ATP-binding protein